MAAPVRTHSQLKINSARNSFFKRVFFAHPAPPCRPRKGAKKRANRNRPSHANNLPARKRPTSADTNETEAEKKKRTDDQEEEEEEEEGGGQEEKIGRKNAPVVRGFAAATAIDNKRGRVEQGNRHSTRI